MDVEVLQLKRTSDGELFNVGDQPI